MSGLYLFSAAVVIKPSFKKILSIALWQQSTQYWLDQ